MSIKTSVLLTVNLIALLFLGVILVSTNAIIGKSFKTLERSDILDELERVNLEVQRSLDAMEISTRDWATWDDTYAFASSPNPQYVESNFTYSTYDNYNLRLIIVWDKEFKIRYAGYNTPDESDEAVLLLPPTLEFALSELHDDLAKITEEDAFRGLWHSPVGNLMFVVMPILKSNGTGPVNGYFMMAKPFSEDFFREMRGFPSTRVEALDLEKSKYLGLTFQDKIAKLATENLVEHIGADSVRASSLIRDINDKSLYMVEVTSKARATVEGKNLRNFVLLLFVLLSGLQSILLSRFLQRRVLNRLLSVQKQLRKLSDNPDQKEVVQLKGNDELADLTENVNSLLTALHLALAAKNDFFSSMSHEIRNPLNGIMGMTSLLKETELDEDQKEYLGALIESSTILSKLILEVLELSKMEYFGSTLHHEPFDLRQCLQTVFVVLGNKAKDKNLILQSEVSPDIPPTLYGDVGKLKQVLLNLIGNAIQYTQRGKVTLRVLSNDMPDKYEFEILDTGIGMTASEVEALGMPFTRFDKYPDQEVGNGLGIYISQKLISLMGGKLQVSSEPGKGTRIRFSLVLPKAAKTKLDD
ncbi:MAG: CHASE4 domain-containing protein [Candidatus Cloacimonetes bacterium]|nr:CHASE4 domain-containing protein [Candidatus Cloacimonadota bacterium]